MKRAGKRWTAAVLAAAMAFSGPAGPALAGPPRVLVDETMYVNLDYYGGVEQVNVVKGCSTGGILQYTDYGEYEEVINMTDRSKPEVGDGAITWILPQDKNRFYFQGTMPKESTQLPWTFDISYKLNGEQADAASLAGASGLVEIRIQATPNPKARAYDRNNMLLFVAVPVDMEKCRSVEAPGAQLQSLGSSTVALFAALPGEEGDYTVRIGADQFESTGVIMTMAPGTADAFLHIKDLKEAKDTWREDADALYDSMNRLLRSMEETRGDLEEAGKGLGDLDAARGQINANRSQIEALSAQALSDLQSLTDQTAVLIPYLQTAQNAVSDINANTDALYNTMEDMQDELDRLYDRLKSLERTLSSSSGRIRDGLSEEEKQAVSQLILGEVTATQEILAALEALGASGSEKTEAIEEKSRELEESLDTLSTARMETGADEEAAEEEETEAEETAVQEEAAEEKETEAEEAAAQEEAADTEETEAEETAVQEEAAGGEVSAFGTVETGTLVLADAAAPEENGGGQADGSGDADRVGPSGEPGSGGVNDASWEEEIGNAADEVEESLETLSGTYYLSDVRNVAGQSRALLAQSGELSQSVTALLEKVNGICADLGSVERSSAQTASAMRRVTDETVNLLDDTRVLIDTADSYVPSVLDGLSESEELLNRLARSLGSTYNLLSLVHGTLTAAGDQLDAGLAESLQSMQGVLEQSLSMIDSLTQVRLAGEGMKETIDGQLDQFEEENLFLNLDPEAERISFTSPKNPSPNSLQIVVRSDEISEEDDAADAVDLEAEDSREEGPFQRMWNVLVAIVQAVVEIFRDR